MNVSILSFDYFRIISTVKIEQHKGIVEARTNIPRHSIGSLDYLCGRSEKYLDFTPKACPPLMEWLPTVINECGKNTYRIFEDTRIKVHILPIGAKDLNLFCLP